MTPCRIIYDAFLAKILTDDWEAWTIEEAKQDWYQILQGALPYFKFPRVSLEHSEEGFTEDLTNEEVQIIANYMKCEWLNRTLLSWDNIQHLYDERDYSPANMLDKMNNALEIERKNALDMESRYYRSIKGRSFKYGQLAEN